MHSRNLIFRHSYLQVDGLSLKVRNAKRLPGKLVSKLPIKFGMAVRSDARSSFMLPVLSKTNMTSSLALLRQFASAPPSTTRVSVVEVKIKTSENGAIASRRHLVHEGYIDDLGISKKKSERKEKVMK